jgi:hypothetical protein
MRRETMPESWRPSIELAGRLSSANWTAEEAQYSSYAVHKGLNELNDFFERHPEAISEIGADAVEAFINASYAAENMPSLKRAAREAARLALVELIAPYLDRRDSSITCSDYADLVTYAIYAHTLLEPGDPRHAKLVSLTNSANRACDTIVSILDCDPVKILADPNSSIDDVYELVVWAVTFIEAQVVPRLELRDDARELPARLWRYLEVYPLVGAAGFTEGPLSDDFIATAYLATHIGYIPTGYGRHPIHVEDSPRLYDFIRSNFYTVLESTSMPGQLDLLSEFVDLLRQYGCTEENDLQVRDGTRYLLELFRGAGESWVAYFGPGESQDESFYDSVHKPWTGMAGVRARVMEQPVAGTYGGVVRSWLDPAG